MIIGIDLRILARDVNTGVEEYAKKLLSFLIPLDKNIKYKIFYNAYNKIPLDYEWARAENVKIFKSSIPNKFLEISGNLGFPKIDKLLGGCDIFFQPHFLPAALSRNIKRVITFHDLSFERYPEFFSWRQKFWHKRINPRKQAEQADKIIAISESTKSDLVGLYGIAPDKIKVVYSGASFPKNITEIEKKSCAEKYNLPADFIPLRPKTPWSCHGDEGERGCPEVSRKGDEGMKTAATGDEERKIFRYPAALPQGGFILFLGTLEPRKNILGAIKAFEVLKNNQRPDLKLVIAGGRGWLCRELFDYAGASKYKNDIIFLGRVLDKEKEILYSLAKVFVFPSFFEGFGFPPLEAMACGTPVVTSNTSSLPEVARDSALMINPYKTDEIAGAVRALLDDNNLKTMMVEKGKKRARQFSWQKCAEETLNFIVQ